MNQKFILIILVIVLLAVGSAAYYDYAIIQKGQNTQESIKEPQVDSGNREIMPVGDDVKLDNGASAVDDTNTGRTDILSWKTYRDEKLGFEIKYPSDFIESPKGLNQILFTKKEVFNNPLTT